VGGGRGRGMFRGVHSKVKEDNRKGGKGARYLSRMGIAKKGKKRSR
jgi:hypothetical protein